MKFSLNRIHDNLSDLRDHPRAVLVKMTPFICIFAPCRVVKVLLVALAQGCTIIVLAH